MTDPRPTKLRRYARRAALALAMLMAGFAALFVSLDPTVAAPSRPTSRDIAAARAVWQQLALARGADVGRRVRVDDTAMGSIAALANDATGLARFDGGIARGVLLGEASVPLPAGLWINVSASAAGEHVGFPEVSLKVGRVRFPLVVGRWAADLLRARLEREGVPLPPLDQMIRRVEIDRREVIADLVLPQESGLVRGLISARAPRLDEPLVGRIYCRIAAAQRTAPVRDLPGVVALAFDPTHAVAGEDFNRAAFVALAFAVVGEKA
ncbi:MAG TPA: hypothetical protein VI168_09600, partial [Croceibacterium sp.]